MSTLLSRSLSVSGKRLKSLVRALSGGRKLGRKATVRPVLAKRQPTPVARRHSLRQPGGHGLVRGQRRRPRFSLGGTKPLKDEVEATADAERAVTGKAAVSATTPHSDLPKQGVMNRSG